MTISHGLAAIVLLATLPGCASAQLSEAGRGVRLTKALPQGCKYLGEVKGEEHGDTIKGARLLTSGEAAHDRSRADLKNKAALMGADTVEVVSDSDEAMAGEAYKCGT
jgi:hypothetical protein